MEINGWMLALSWIGAAFAGYRIGLVRARDILWEACQDEAKRKVEEGTPKPFYPSVVRKMVLAECIGAVSKMRPKMGGEPGTGGSMSAEDWNRCTWLCEGIDDALQAIRMLDDPKAAINQRRMYDDLMPGNTMLGLDRIPGPGEKNVRAPFNWSDNFGNTKFGEAKSYDITGGPAFESPGGAGGPGKVVIKKDPPDDPPLP